MRQARFLAPWKDSTEKPALYHCVSRAVERRYAFGAKELADAREKGDDAMVAEIHARFTYRMNDLGQFMKGLMQRFTQWFNGRHQRTGTLWDNGSRA